MINATNSLISILSLYTEGDMWDIFAHFPYRKFQSSPSIQRETYKNPEIGRQIITFQSSPSMQRETRYNLGSKRRICISILSLYAEGD